MKNAIYFASLCCNSTLSHLLTSNGHLTSDTYTQMHLLHCIIPMQTFISIQMLCAQTLFKLWFHSPWQKEEEKLLLMKATFCSTQYHDVGWSGLAGRVSLMLLVLVRTALLLYYLLVNTGFFWPKFWRLAEALSLQSIEFFFVNPWVFWQNSWVFS